MRKNKKFIFEEEEVIVPLDLVIDTDSDVLLTSNPNNISIKPLKRRKLQLTYENTLKHLFELLGEKGRLKIITPNPNPDRDPRASRLRPSYFIHHNVVSIDVRNPMDITARSEEGDWCNGNSISVLGKLTEWEREPEFEGKKTLLRGK